MLTTTITFEGNLTSDPDLRFTTTVRPVVEFTVLVNQRTRTDAGEWVDAEPTRHVVKAFGVLAENITESLAKGDRVIVYGHVVTNTWRHKETGDKRTAPRVLADTVGPSLRWATTRITKTHPHRDDTDE